MARLDVYRLEDDESAFYVLDVQADLLDELQTRVVVPLIPAASGPRPIGGINPVFDVGGAPHIFMVQNIASVPARMLRKPTQSLSGQRDAVTRALDILFLGF